MTFQIGDLEKKSKVNKETIRYYEHLGIIPKPQRTNSGYRIYSEDMVERLRFIKRMKELGFTLKEIEKLLGVVDQDEMKCQNIHEFTEEKLQDIQVTIRDLKRIERMLSELNSCCCSPDDTDIYQCEIIGTVLLDDEKQQ